MTKNEGYGDVVDIFRYVGGFLNVIGDQHLRVVTDTSRLQHPSPTLMSPLLRTPLGFRLNVCWLCKIKKTGSFLKPVKRTNLNFTILAFKWHSMKYLKISKFLCEWHCFIALLFINTNLSSFSIWTQLLLKNLRWFVRILRKFWICSRVPITWYFSDFGTKFCLPKSLRKLRPFLFK